MSSWASAEWHSLVEHVGHRLKLILLRRLHLQRPTAIDVHARGAERRSDALRADL
jgi:hypothetical protein